jgi:DNA-binding CsgD family transcriptional regulator
MAGALGGEPDRLDTVVYCCCRMIATCSAVFEHGRAASWIRAAEQFTRRYGGLHLQLHCRVHYGGVLLATGRWEEAETELLEAAAASARAERVLHAEAVARLAELRVAQGRLDEAERLLAGLDERPATVAPRAALHLAAGRPDAAALAARRGGGPSCVELLVQAEIALGAIEPALSRALDLVQTGDADVALAYGERAAGRALIAAGEPGQAVERLERALAIFARREMPYEAARARLALAQALSAGRPEAAAAEASGAQDVFERLGAGRDADAAAALLRSLGIRAGRRGPRGADVLTKRETEVLALLAEGYSNAAIAERLFLSRKTVEHHVHRVLLKLGLRGRSEAAAYLVRDRGAK